MNRHLPHVTVLTPVYNGEAYIAECIESVIAQTHTNWEYVIVNNCSTDATLQIATRYAEQDARIRIVNNASFVGVIENHNIAFPLVSPESAYCKVVSADDWIYPECLERMVDVAERHPSVGIVSCYSITDTEVRHRDLGARREVYDGRSICRIHMLSAHVLTAPTTVLYRADLVRRTQPFFSVPLPAADVHASFAILQEHDYGFVHQVLCFQRVHERSVSAGLIDLNTLLLDRLHYVVTYGPNLLTDQQRERRLAELLAEYHEFLADQALHFAGRDFWNYHRARIAELGLPMSYARVAGVMALKLFDWGGNPKQSMGKILRRLRSWRSVGGRRSGGLERLLHLVILLSSQEAIVLL